MLKCELRFAFRWRLRWISWKFKCSDRILFSLSHCKFLSSFHLFSFNFLSYWWCVCDGRLYLTIITTDSFAIRMQELHRRLLCEYFTVEVCHLNLIEINIFQHIFISNSRKMLAYDSHEIHSVGHHMVNTIDTKPCGLLSR